MTNYDREVEETIIALQREVQGLRADLKRLVGANMLVCTLFEQEPTIESAIDFGAAIMRLKELAEDAKKWEA